MRAFFNKTAEGFREKLDPSYLEAKTKTKAYLQQFGIRATVAFVASVAFAALGAVLTASNKSIWVLGPPLVLLGVPASYLSYNVSKASFNLKEFVENPNNAGGILNTNKEDMKTKLREGTICFDWAIDIAIQQIFNAKS